MTSPCTVASQPLSPSLPPRALRSQAAPAAAVVAEPEMRAKPMASSPSTAPSRTPRPNSSRSPGPTGRKRTTSTSSTKARRSSRRRSAVRAQGGNAPDLAIFPQPGLLADLASRDYIQPAPEGVASNVAEYWSEDWAAYGTVDGTLYGAPLMASVKGFVWYSPAEFAEPTAGRCPRHGTTCSALTADMQTTPVGRSGARASAPTPRPDGRAPTGSRTSCFARPVPRSTTSGSATRSRSPTRRSPTRSTRSATSCSTRTTSTRASATSSRSTARRSVTRHVRSATGTCHLHHQASFYDGFIQDPDERQRHGRTRR